MKERYEIIKQIGEGGTGKTFIIKDLKLGRNCVMKKIRRDKNIFNEAIKRETSALLKIRHPSIPTLTDIVYEKEFVCLIMEYIRGLSLKEIIDSSGPLRERDIINIGISLARVGEYLHELAPPMIHGDIKPQNIIIHKEKVYLVDFGAAISFGQPWGDDIMAYSKGYSSPDLQKGKGPDMSWDIYSLGAVLFFLSTGQDPGGVRGIFPVREWNPRLSQKLESCIKYCCLTDREKRCKTMKEVIERLSSPKIDTKNKRDSTTLFRPIKSLILTEGEPLL